MSCVLILYAAGVAGQRRYAGFAHLSVADGLPSNTVYNCLQDRNGYLWLGTDAGVTRYDGIRFTHYTTLDGLGDNEILDLYEDHSGRVWFIPYTGRISYFRDGILHSPDKDTLLRRMAAFLQLQCPAEDGAGNLYFLANGNPRMLILSRDGQIRQSELSTLVPGAAKSIFRAKNKICISTYEGGIFDVSDGRTGRRIFASSSVAALHHFASNPKSHIPLSFNQDGIYGWKELQPRLLVDFKRYPLQQPLKGEGGVILHMDQEERIWLTYAHHPTRLFRKTGGIYTTGIPVLPDLTCLVSRDREQQLWFCTPSAGVYKIGAAKLDQLLGTPASRFLAGSTITAVFVGPDSNAWIGTNDNQIVRVKGAQLYRYNANPGSVFSRVLQIIADRMGNIHIATDVSLLQIRKTSQGYSDRITEIRYRDGQPVTRVKSIAVDTAGIIYPLVPWLQIQHKLYPGEVKLRSEPLPVWQPKQRLFSHFIDRENIRYVSTRNGIGYITGDSIRYLDSAARYVGSYVTSYAQLKDGMVLMTTSGSGLLAVKRQEVLACLNRANGLKGLACRKVVLRNDTAFIATNAGITMVRYEAGRFRVLQQLTTEQGLISNDVNDLDFADTAMLVATADGLSVLGAGMISKYRPPPVVLFRHFRVDDSAYQLRQPIVFPSREQYVRISFVAPTLEQPEQVSYRFRLSGHGEDWQETSADEVAFSRLPYGHYQFELQARRVNSAWSESAFLSFRITPPFYARWWFRLLLLVSGFAALFGLYRYLLQKRLARQIALMRQQRALEAERNRIASDLHDDIGSELTHITMLSSRLRTEQATPELLARLEQSSDQAIRKMNEVVWTLHAQDDTLHNVAAYLRSEARRYLMEHGLEHRLRVEESVYTQLKVTALFRRHLVLVLKELLHNIVKHARAGMVMVTISRSDAELELVVSDDGIGFDTAAAAAGNGLRNIRKRVKSMGGHCEIHTGKGTTVRIILPLNDPYAS